MSVTLTGENVTSVTPIDLMLVVDESGSISTSEFASLRSFLQNFTSSMTTLFENGGRIGLSMFSGTGERWPDVPSYKGQSRIISSPTQDSSALIQLIGQLQRQGQTTCISCGLEDANTELSAVSGDGRKRIAIVFTDGQHNATRAALHPSTELDQRIQELHDSGTTVMAVGVGGGINAPQLQKIASGDGNQNVFTVSSYSSLTGIVAQLAAAVVEPEATNAELVLEVNPAFTVSSPSIDAGSVTLNGNTITWTIPELQDQDVTLSYQVAHAAASGSGSFALHDSVSYTDDEGNPLEVPELQISVTGCDLDGDSINDEDDACADTEGGATTDAQGCSLAQHCPCDGAFANHGAYVSCVSRSSQDFVQAGLMSNKERAVVVKTAASGSCGK